MPQIVKRVKKPGRPRKPGRPKKKKSQKGEGLKEVFDKVKSIAQKVDTFGKKTQFATRGLAALDAAGLRGLATSNPYTGAIVSGLELAKEKRGWGKKKKMSIKY